MAVDLFRRVSIKGTQQGLNLSDGSYLASQDDYLIHTLEQRPDATARVISQNEAPQTANIDVIEDGAFWALSTELDFPYLSETMADVTTLMGVETSSDFWTQTSYGGITTYGV